MLEAPNKRTQGARRRPAMKISIETTKTRKPGQTPRFLFPRNLISTNHADQKSQSPSESTTCQRTWHQAAPTQSTLKPRWENHTKPTHQRCQKPVRYLIDQTPNPATPAVSSNPASPATPRAARPARLGELGSDASFSSSPRSNFH